MPGRYSEKPRTTQENLRKAEIAKDPGPSHRDLVFMPTLYPEGLDPSPSSSCMLLCWNFEGLLPAHSGGYRDELEAPSSHLLGVHFGHKSDQQYEGLKPFKTVLQVILGLASDTLQLCKTCYCPKRVWTVFHPPPACSLPPVAKSEGPS